MTRQFQWIIGKAEEIAAGDAWLASDESSYFIHRWRYDIVPSNYEWLRTI